MVIHYLLYTSLLKTKTYGLLYLWLWTRWVFCMHPHLGSTIGSQTLHCSAWVLLVCQSPVFGGRAGKQARPGKIQPLSWSIVAAAFEPVSESRLIRVSTLFSRQPARFSLPVYQQIGDSCLCKNRPQRFPLHSANTLRAGGAPIWLQAFALAYAAYRQTCFSRLD